MRNTAPEDCPSFERRRCSRRASGQGLRPPREPNNTLAREWGGAGAGGEIKEKKGGEGGGEVG